MFSTAVLEGKTGHAAIGSARSRLTWREPLLVFAMFWSIIALCNSGFDESEGAYHYELAKQFLRTGTLSYAERPNQWIGYVPGPDGKFYCAHEIGNTLFSMPSAALTLVVERVVQSKLDLKIIKRLTGFIFSFQAGICIALTLTVFYWMLRSNFGQSLKASLLSTTLLLVTTPMLGYTRISYDGVFAGLVLLAGFWQLLEYRRLLKTSTLVLAFTFLGFAVITRLTLVLGVFSGGLYLLAMPLSVRQKLKALMISGMVLLPFVAWQGWYNALRTGSCVKAPIIALNPFNDNIFEGLAGLLISPGKGVFLYAPLLMLSLLALPRMRKRFLPELCFIASLTVAWLFVHARLDRWDGCWCLGPRYFITLMPLMFLPLAVNLKGFLLPKQSLRKAVVCVVLFWGLWLNIGTVAVDFGFRHTYLEATNVSRHDLLWSFEHSQSVDLALSSLGNVVRAFTDQPIVTLRGTNLSETAWPMAIQYGSSTLNVWPNIMVYLGAPIAAMSAAVILLLACAIYALRCLLQLDGTPPEPKTLIEIAS